MAVANSVANGVPHLNGDGPLATDQAPHVNLKHSNAHLLESQSNGKRELSADRDLKSHTTGENKNVLHITDGRTGNSYDIPITHNSVRALDFKVIKATSGKDLNNSADDAEGGLRLLDPGFQNTAVKESKITFV